MKTLNKGAAAGRIFYPPGWRMYCLGFGAGLVVATPGLVAGQTDDATISGVAAFFGFTVGVWLAISLSLFLFGTFAMYLDGLRNRVDGLRNRLERLDVLPMAATDKKAAGRKRSSITKHLGTTTLYVFPSALTAGLCNAIAGVLYAVGELDYGPMFIAAVTGGAVAAGCLAALGIWCIVQEWRLKKVDNLSDLLAYGDVAWRNSLDLVVARMSKFLGYLTANPRA